MDVPSRTLALWYAQLASHLEAGLSLEHAVGAVNGPHPEKRALLQGRLAAGDDVEEALARGAPWLPEVDRHLLGVAASVGRLPDMLRRVAARHEAAVRSGRQALLASAYPLIVAHLAIVLLPVAELFTGAGVSAYLAQVGRILLPLWLAGALGWWAVRRRWPGAGWVLDRLPLYGGFRRFRALADFVFLLDVQGSAGVRPDVAWLRAAQGAGDRRLEPVALAVAAAVQRGETASTGFAGRKELPAPFADFYASGERTGRLEENLGRLQQVYRETADARLRHASVSYPAMLFVGIGGWIAFRIISFWLGYFRQLDQFQ